MGCDENHNDYSNDFGFNAMVSFLGSSDKGVKSAE